MYSNIRLLNDMYQDQLTMAAAVMYSCTYANSMNIQIFMLYFRGCI